jgi:hypothetical protein
MQEAQNRKPSMKKVATLTENPREPLDHRESASANQTVKGKVTLFWLSNYVNKSLVPY